MVWSTTSGGHTEAKIRPGIASFSFWLVWKGSAELGQGRYRGSCWGRVWGDWSTGRKSRSNRSAPCYSYPTHFIINLSALSSTQTMPRTGSNPCRTRNTSCSMSIWLHWRMRWLHSGRWSRWDGSGAPKAFSTRKSLKQQRPSPTLNKQPEISSESLLSISKNSV